MGGTKVGPTKKFLAKLWADRWPRCPDFLRGKSASAKLGWFAGVMVGGTKVGPTHHLSTLREGS